MTTAPLFAEVLARIIRVLLAMWAVGTIYEFLSGSGERHGGGD